MKIMQSALFDFTACRRITIGVISMMVMPLSMINLYGQGSTKEITGKITTLKTKESLPGVSIAIKGTTTGTVADVDGQYTVQASTTDVLVFSFIGYVTEEIAIGTRDVINVSLSEDMSTLEEVIVVGYGEQKRSNVTGALSVVKVADLENKTQFRLDQALQGMAAGVNVTRNGGAPGAAPTIHVRGVGSIGNTDPLWIIDGIRMDPGNSFDVSDVESMEVLKDASASAIYGVQAANGVILVKTKRGKGGLQVNFKTSVGQRQPLKLPHLLNSEDYVKYKKEGRLNAGQNPEPGWDNYTADTDWIRAFYNGSGMIQSNSVSVAKGDDKSNYFLSFGNDNEKGILIDNTYKRYSMRLNSDLMLARWLKLGETIILSKVLENPIGNNNESVTGGIPYRSVPTMPIYDATNTYGGWGRGEAYFQGPNPVATQYQQHETRTTNRFDGNVFLEVTPFHGLVVRSTVGLNYYSYMTQQFNEAFDYGYFSNHIAQLTYGYRTTQALTANGVVTYSKSMKKHDFKIMAGYESWQVDGRHFNVTGNGYPIAVAQSLNLTTGAIASTDRYNVDQDRLLSQFGRFNYSYDNKYLIEANLRRDGSSKFSPDNLWAVFPSFSVGWKISEEKFFQAVPVISSLKLRASQGKLGYTGGIANFSYQSPYTSQFSTYSFDAAGANKVPGFYLSRFSNRDIRFEESNMTDVAMDMRLFQNKFSISIDYYKKDTKGLLVPVPIPASVGISTHNFDAVSPVFNVGTLRNTGIDIDLSYTTSLNKFNLTINGNTSFMKNKMLSLFGQYITGGDGGGQIGGMTRTYAGKPISSFYGYQVQQMLNTPSDIYAINTYSKDGIYQEASTAPGDLMYRDLGGPTGVPDGKVTAAYDRTILGNPWPKMTYALNTTVVYNKIIDISIQFQGVQGVDVFNANKSYARNFFGDDNSTILIHDAWTPDHHTNNPRNVANDPNGNFSKPSTYFLENGSYFKLRNLQIGFNVPQAWLSKINLKHVRIYGNGNNLLTLTRYTGTDPEIAGTNVSRGVDYGLYPQVRTYSAGLEVQF